MILSGNSQDFSFLIPCIGEVVLDVGYYLTLETKIKVVFW